MRAQLNVRVGKAIRNRIAADRRNTFATNDIIVEVALENWFTSQPSEAREKYYKAHGRKPYEKAAGLGGSASTAMQLAEKAQHIGAGLAGLGDALIQRTAHIHATGHEALQFAPIGWISRTFGETWDFAPMEGRWTE